MALSNSYDYTITRNEIIEQAYRLSGILDQESTPTTTEYANAAASLNMIVKAYMMKGVRMWAWEDVIFFPELSKPKYTVGTSGDRFCLASDFFETTLSGAVTSGATTVTLTSTTGIVANDAIGFYSSALKAVGWRVVSSVSGNDVTLTTAITADFTDGSKVFSYTSLIPKPLRISDAMLQIGTSSKTIIAKISQQEYSVLSNLSLAGNPTQYYYKPRIDDGELFLYPTPQDEAHYIRFVIEKPFDDLDASGDTLPMPSEYYNILKYALAEELLLSYGFTQRASILAQKLERLALEASTYDYEDASIRMELEEGY